MSFSRFGAEDSDVYTFPNTSGEYECCACPLGERDFYTRDASVFIEHLRSHRRNGHTVPLSAFAQVKAWAAQYPDGWRPERRVW